MDASGAGYVWVGKTERGPALADLAVEVGSGSGSTRVGVEGRPPFIYGTLVRDIGHYFGGNMAAMAVQAVSGLLVARWAGPENMGYFNTASLLLAYAPFLLLGVNNALNRDLPLLIGQGRRAEAQALADMAWWWLRLIGLCAFVVTAAAGAWMWSSGGRRLGEAWLAFALIVPLTFLSQTIEVTYRTSSAFVQLSRIRVVNAIAAILTAGVILMNRWWGLLGRAVVLQLVYSCLLLRKRPIVANARYDGELLARSVRLGFPIFLVGFLFSAFAVLDRTLILRYLGSREMGLYTPAIQVFSGLAILPASINQVLYPRMCELYGRSRSPRSLAGLAFGPVVVLSIVLLPLFALGWWVTGPFVHLLLPKYAEGIGAARWAVVTSYFCCLSSPQNVFPTLDRLGWFVISILVGAGTTWALTVWLLRLGWGLSAVGGGMAGGMAAVVLASTSCSAILIYGGATGRSEVGHQV